MTILPSEAAASRRGCAGGTGLSLAGTGSAGLEPPLRLRLPRRFLARGSLAGAAEPSGGRAAEGGRLGPSLSLGVH